MPDPTQQPSPDGWIDLPAVGRFVDPAHRASADPYLVWAEATDFVDLRREGDIGPARVRVLVELCKDVTPQRLRDELAGHGDVSEAYVARAELRHCTARFDAQACRRFCDPDNGIVQRFELAEPVVPRRTPQRAEPPVAPPRTAVAERCAGSVLLAVIDHGCPFAHAAFRRRGQPRVLSLWDQDRRPAFGTAALPGTVPAAFGYGREICRQEIADLLTACTGAGPAIDEDRCYEAARYPELRRAATHGAHVMDQFIGPRRLGDRMPLDGEDSPGWRDDGQEISDSADLVFVQLPRDAWADPNALALPVCVLDGLHHVLSCAGPTVRNVVVNLSCAITTGPHDGSTLIDKALEALVEVERTVNQRHLHIVVPAGNTAQDAWHAAGRIDNQHPGHLRWRVPPGCEAPSFLQLWPGERASTLDWTVQAPGAMGAQQMPRDGALGLVQGGRLRALALRSFSSARGGRNGCLRLALAAAPLPDSPGSAGDWLLELNLAVDATVGEVPLQAYVARSQSELGALQRHRVSRLIDPLDDADRFLRPRLEDSRRPANQPLHLGLRVRRDGTASALTHCRAVTVAAGARLRPFGPADFSGAGLDENRSVAGISEESHALLGIRGAGTRSGCVVRLRGTSFAAPQWARRKADLLREKDAKPGLPVDPRTVIAKGNGRRLGLGLVRSKLNKR
jgi:hypothetical protein